MVLFICENGFTMRANQHIIIKFIQKVIDLYFHMLRGYTNGQSLYKAKQNYLPN